MASTTADSGTRIYSGGTCTSVRPPGCHKITANSISLTSIVVLNYYHGNTVLSQYDPSLSIGNGQLGSEVLLALLETVISDGNGHRLPGAEGSPGGEGDSSSRGLIVTPS